MSSYHAGTYVKYISFIITHWYNTAGVKLTVGSASCITQDLRVENDDANGDSGESSQRTGCT
jgi:hypothetical protein